MAAHPLLPDAVTENLLGALPQASPLAPAPRTSWEVQLSFQPSGQGHGRGGRQGSSVKMGPPPAEPLPGWHWGSCREMNTPVKALLAQWAGRQHGGDTQTSTSLPTQK